MSHRLESVREFFARSERSQDTWLRVGPLPLRRCGQVEATFPRTIGDTAAADTAAPAPDPMQTETAAKLQLSVDRARSQSHRLLHKCTAELRRLQTDRHFLSQAFGAGADLSAFGICDHRAIQKSLDHQVSAHLRKRHLAEAEQFDEMCAVTTERANQLLTIQTQSAPSEAATIARNALCLCQSAKNTSAAAEKTPHRSCVQHDYI